MTRRPLLIALAATAAVFLWQALTIHYNYQGNWTALFFTGDRQPLPPELSSGTYRIPHATGYDGQYYRLIAHDPLLKNAYDRYLDRARLRYRRILVPVLAWALAGGNRQWVDATYLLVILASVFLGVFWSAQYVQLDHLPAALGLVLLLDPATLTSIDRMLLDGVVTTLVVGFILAERKRNHGLRYVTSLLAPLVKETGFVLVCAAVLADLWRRQYRRAVISATAALPSMAWFAYVEVRTTSPEPTHLVTLPFLGIVGRIFTFRELPDARLQAAFRAVDLLSILGFAATLWLAWRCMRKDGITATTLLMGIFLAMALIFGHSDHMLDAYGYARPVSPLLLYVMLRGLAARDWRYLVPPLLVTLSILIYFVKPLLGILRNMVFISGLALALLYRSVFSFTAPLVWALPREPVWRTSPRQSRRSLAPRSSRWSTARPSRSPPSETAS